MLPEPAIYASEDRGWGKGGNEKKRLGARRAASEHAARLNAQ